MKCNSLSAWFPEKFLPFLTILKHIQQEISIGKTLDLTLHEKFRELEHMFFNIKKAFRARRAEMSAETETVLEKQLSNLERFYVIVSITFGSACMNNTRATKLLEERTNAWVKFCESRVLKGARYA